MVASTAPSNVAPLLLVNVNALAFVTASTETVSLELELIVIVPSVPALRVPITIAPVASLPLGPSS